MGQVDPVNFSIDSSDEELGTYFFVWAAHKKLTVPFLDEISNIVKSLISGSPNLPDGDFCTVCLEKWTDLKMSGKHI